MTFGKRLRYAREARGWSRFRLTLAVKERFRIERATISEAAIQDIETGKCINPRATTQALLAAVFPELSQSITPNDSQPTPQVGDLHHG